MMVPNISGQITILDEPETWAFGGDSPYIHHDSIEVTRWGHYNLPKGTRIAEEELCQQNRCVKERRTLAFRTYISIKHIHPTLSANPSRQHGERIREDITSIKCGRTVDCWSPAWSALQLHCVLVWIQKATLGQVEGLVRPSIPWCFDVAQPAFFGGRMATIWI